MDQMTESLRFLTNSLTSNNGSSVKTTSALTGMLPLDTMEKLEELEQILNSESYGSTHWTTMVSKILFFN